MARNKCIIIIIIIIIMFTFICNLDMQCRYYNLMCIYSTELPFDLVSPLNWRRGNVLSMSSHKQRPPVAAVYHVISW